MFDCWKHGKDAMIAFLRRQIEEKDETIKHLWEVVEQLKQQVMDSRSAYKQLWDETHAVKQEAKDERTPDAGTAEKRGPVSSRSRARTRTR